MNFVVYFLCGLVLIKYLIHFFGFIVIKIYLTLIEKRALKRKDTVFRNELNLSVDSNSFFKNEIKFISHYLNGYIRYTLIRIGRIPSHTIRGFLYKNFFNVKLHKTSVLYGGAEIRCSYNIEIGQGSIIGDNSILDARNGIMIGKHVNFSTGVWIWTEQHDYNCPYFNCNDKGGKVEIHDRAWIGSRVTILPNIIIGEGAVVATGSVVTKNVEPYTLVGGIPAKKIGTRSQELKYEFNGDHIPFY